MILSREYLKDCKLVAIQANHSRNDNEQFVFSFRDGKGKRFRVYCLVEHSSTVKILSELFNVPFTDSSINPPERLFEFLYNQDRNRIRKLLKRCKGFLYNIHLNDVFVEDITRCKKPFTLNRRSK